VTGDPVLRGRGSFPPAGRDARRGVINKAGHKLPTGYPEGRQMWLHLEVEDAQGNPVFVDGRLDSDGTLVRTEQTKVYECIPVAEGYEDVKLPGSPYSILDADRDGVVSHSEKEFHFVLNNVIEKDNRIPPAGFNREAYMKDGAFIVPRDPSDNDYADGQNWDVTRYRIPLPKNFSGTLSVKAGLRFQTFSREFIDFLGTRDEEETVKFGGHARNVPDGPFENVRTWGKVTRKLWKKAGKGFFIDMVSDRMNVVVH